MELDKEELEATRNRKCEYCEKRATNKKIPDVDNDENEEARVIFLGRPFLKVELDGTDSDGYKTADFFQINYCPMCGRKLV